MNRQKVTIDGNEAAGYCAYHTNEVIIIYPITPSSPMGEFADEWAAESKPNIWGVVPQVTEMQSEGGAAGAVHGALQAGSLTATFTASQGLLLMIPNMFKIAGELTSTVFHVSARTIAAHALSIFGDHSDVMSCRSCGFAMLSSNSVQEAMDFALIAQAATLEARVPFLHFFDGFRTSHEVSKVELLTIQDMRTMMSQELINEHRNRALSPERPFIRGTAQNPDVFFQARERANPYYIKCPEIVEKAMDKFFNLTKREYHIFQYAGDPSAERVIVIMGSGGDTVEETINYLNLKGEKAGVIKVRLFRPFSFKHLIKVLPKTVETVAVLDRTKEPGSSGEPLYLDVVNAINEAKSCGLFPVKSGPRIIGGRFGLSSKEFTPGMVASVFAEMTKSSPKNHFTIGIKDDVTETSLEYEPNFSIEPQSRTRAVFYGLGSDGTVSANKNSIKIIGEETENFAQGYFVYDSKKAGSVTISHLRFGPTPINSPYLINKANFVACHQFLFLERFDILKAAETGATFLLNASFSKEKVWEHLPITVQKQLIDKKLRFFIIDAYRIAQELGLGIRINTIMQTAFFILSKVIAPKQAIESIKRFIKKTYGSRGEAVVNMNFSAVDLAVDNLYQVQVPDKVTSTFDMRPPVPSTAPEFVRSVTAEIISGRGDELPVSAFSPDGTFPSSTTKWEKRNIALQIPVWDSDTCIQCGKCVLVCPHAVIRSKVYDKSELSSMPPAFKHTDARWQQFPDMCFTVQVSPEDCTGCALCVAVCPAKNKKEPKLRAINMQPQPPLRDKESENWKFFLDISDPDRGKLKTNLVKDVQLIEPLFEFSGACAGCGETQYIKLLSQLFGDRLLVANATGCSSIYGGNLPTTPWSVNKDGRGPAWSNSLFEDNAEFGLGMRLSLDKQKDYADYLLRQLSSAIGDRLAEEVLEADQSTEEGIRKQRERVKIIKDKLEKISTPAARDLINVIDSVVKKSVWIVGGDGWAYDIGYGGLDHVLALGKKVNVLVLDTEVYSNTGGQMSKSTPRGAVAKFAAAGKQNPKKDLALMLITYGNIYVARVAMGANDGHTLKAILEAEQYSGPSIIIAYSHCIAHGYNLALGMEQQKLAVSSGHWPLLRYNPALVKEGKNPFQLDSNPASIPLENYIYNETRYKMLTVASPDEAKRLLECAKEDVAKRWELYQYWASMPVNSGVETKGQDISQAKKSPDRVNNNKRESTARRGR